jgi:putative acetyltransferase
MIRKYKEEEILVLVAIWEKSSAIAHPFLDNDFTKMVKTAMTDMYLPNSETWVFEEKNEIIGFISMLDNEIGGLFVLPNHHSKGIGSLLLKHISQFHNELEVEVFDENKIGKPFYIKKGFTLINDYLHEGTNQKVLRMKKHIT